MFSYNKIFRIFLLTALVAILIFASKYLNFQELLRNSLVWIEHLGSWGPLAFIIVYNLATVLLIPGSILTLGGGFIFGILLGSLYVFIAATLGATSAFFIGRYLSRDWVTKQINGNPKFQAIDAAVGRQGLKIVFLTRLSPIFPFNLLNYIFGITQVSTKDYVFGSFGMIPGTIMYVYLGSLAGDIAMLGTQATNPQAEVVQWVIRVVGFIATVAVTIYITRLAQQALEKDVLDNGR